MKISRSVANFKFESADYKEGPIRMASNSVSHRGSGPHATADLQANETPVKAVANGDVKPCYELHRAVFHGDDTRVKELLAIKLNPNAQDKHGKN